MKTAIITFAALSLSLSLSEACGGKRYSKPKSSKSAPAKKSYTSKKKSSSYSRKKSSYTPKCEEPSRPTINIGSESLDPREGFARRMQVAPSGRDSGYPAINSGVSTVSYSANAATNVRMLGKIEYEWGKSTLSYDAAHDIENTLLGALAEHGPNCKIVVFGFADKTGRSSVNLRLSDVRAHAVKEHIDKLSWSRGLRLDTTAIAMGEEVELCRHNFGHNRVAEIWLVDFTRPQPLPVQVTETVAPVQVIQAPVQSVVAQPAELVTVPAATVAPVAADPLAGLIEFLRNNTVLSGNADPNELALRLAAVQSLAR
ncbi:MAG: hypothetical protein P1V20_09440 [Verrucomicrobiales bacterium]|nr:hypothetical protein [Verrucomicrobiales bacterium]